MFSFMNRDYLVPTFAMLIGIWAACWWIGRTPWTVSSRRRALAWLEGAAVAAVVGSFAFTYLVPQVSLLKWQPFSQPALAGLTAEGKTVMIDFTAEWCFNCKLNMRNAIDTQKVAQIVETNHVVPLLADWTEASPEVTQMLNALGHDSIPMLAIFPAGNPNRPIILHDIFTQSQLLRALEEAGPSKREPAVAGQGPARTTGALNTAVERELSRN
jgi:thiol:disulfide interchange protein